MTESVQATFGGIKKVASICNVRDKLKFLEVEEDQESSLDEIFEDSRFIDEGAKKATNLETVMS